MRLIYLVRIGTCTTQGWVSGQDWACVGLLGFWFLVWTCTFGNVFVDRVGNFVSGNVSHANRLTAALGVLYIWNVTVSVRDTCFMQRASKIDRSLSIKEKRE